MSRRSADDVKLDAVGALIGALGGIGVAAAVASPAEDGANVVVDVEGRSFDVEVTSVVTAAHGRRAARSRERHERPLLVVADRIAADAKAAFRRAGLNFYDRRGELRLVEPPLIIDTVVPSARAVPAGSNGPLVSQVAKEVAIACLLTPDKPHGVREIARSVERAPSSVSAAMSVLRDDGLLTSAGEVMIPDLFNELLAVWRKRPVPLAALPAVDGRGRRPDQFGLGLDDPEHTQGWALSDTVAAGSWGMPIVGRGDHPPDFYVPTNTVLRTARSVLGEAPDPATRACTVAVAPVRLVCLRRVDHSETSGQRWPVANHIVVALDIAQDRARGVEALEQWHPEGIVRAW